MTALFRDWIAKYPIVSFEDGLAEDPWRAAASRERRRSDRVQIVGGGNVVTDTAFIRHGIAEGSATTSSSR